MSSVDRSSCRLAPQIFYSLFASISYFSCGLSAGWAYQSVLYANETKMESWSYHVKPKEVPYIPATLELGALLAILPVGYAVDKYGRKYVLLATGFLFLLSWLIVLAADRSPENLYSSRVVAGLGTGATIIGVPTYIAEITDTRIRGFVLTWSKAMVFAGLTTMHALATQTSYGGLVAISSIAPVIFLLTFTWSPESPYLLAMKEKWTRAQENLQSLGCKGNRSTHDLNQLMNNEEEEGIWVPLRQLYWTQPVARATLLIGLLLTVLTSLSGYSAIVSYSAIFLPLSPDPNFPTKVTFVVVLSGVMFGSCVLSACLVDVVGRRPMFLTSAALSTVSLVGIGYLYSRLSSCSETDYCGLPWWYMSAFLLWAFSYNLGLSTIPSTLIAEISPTNARGMTTAITAGVDVFLSLFTTIIVFAVVSNYSGKLVENAGSGFPIIYWTFAACSALAFVAGAIFMPETKGKSLKKIHTELTHKFVRTQVEEVESVRLNGTATRPADDKNHV